MIDRPTARAVWLHLLAATAVLVVLAALSRPGSAYVSDEGAAILQAEQLSRTGDWLYRNPVPELDPNGTAMPFPRGDEGALGRAPYARHPLYPRLLQAARAAGGTAGLAGLAVLGTLGSALAASRLAARIRPELAVPALWAVVVSPLLFDSLLVLGHTLAAAAAAGAVLAFVRAVDAGGSRRWADLAATGVGAAVATALRTEGAFVGLALGGVAVVLVIRGRAVVGPALAGLAAVAGAVGAHLAERAFLASTLGAGAGSASVEGAGWFSGRLDAFVSTWLLPGDRPLPRAAGLLVAGAACFAVAALLTRTGRRDALVGIAVSVAAVAYLARVLVGPEGTIPGLVVAFPLGWTAAWLVRRGDVRATWSLVPALTAVLVAVAVLLTQYPEGGSVEWGGRYFAVAVPLALVPLVAAGRRTLVDPGWDVAARRLVVGSLIVATVATAVLGVRAVRDPRGRTRLAADAVARAAARSGGADVGDDRRPVVVTTEPLLPQLLWPTFHRYRWVVARDAALTGVLERAGRLDVGALVLVTADPDRARRAVPGSYRMGAPTAEMPVSAFVLEPV